MQRPRTVRPTPSDISVDRATPGTKRRSERESPRMDNDRLIRQHLRHMASRGLREETIAHRRANLERLAVALAVPLREATVEDLEDWRAAMARTLAVNSLKTYVSHVRAFYRWAQRHAGLATNPADELPLPRVPRGRPRPIGEDDLALALRCAGEPVRTYLVLGAFLGLRCGEIAHLAPDCLVKGRGGYTIDIVGKGGRLRTLPCPSEVADVLRLHLRSRDGVVFRKGNGDPVTSEYVSRQVAGFLHGLGLGSTAHTLRHRYGSTMYELSGDLRLIQELLGHSSPTTTTIYVAASAERGRITAAKLAEGLSARSGSARGQSSSKSRAA